MAWLLRALFFLFTTTTAACEVGGCHDGDTCRLTCDGELFTIRLFCIDAPELSQQPWGRLSRDALRAQVMGTVRVLVEDEDRHGRLVAELIREDGHNLGLGLVRDGYAAVYPKYCGEPEYYAAEEAAREAKVGIWGVVGMQQKPWEWRH